MKDTMEWDFFFERLSKGNNIDETCFYFTDEPDESEHYLGFLPEYEKPYWVGCCDMPNGKEYYTAEELVNDKIYNGKSLKERWSEVRICSIEGICLEDWLANMS